VQYFAKVQGLLIFIIYVVFKFFTYLHLFYLEHQKDCMLTAYERRDRRIREAGGRQVCGPNSERPRRRRFETADRRIVRCY